MKFFEYPPHCHKKFSSLRHLEANVDGSLRRYDKPTMSDDECESVILYLG